MLRTLFMTLSHSATLRWLCAHFGPARRISRRFIAGETLDQALAVTRDLNRAGMTVTLNHLGEGVATRDDAQRAAQAYIEILQRIAREDVDATISIKPSHLGLGFGQAFFEETLEKVVQKAAELGNWVEVDIEDHLTTEETLGAFHRLLENHSNLRVALQSYLMRTAGDLERLIAKGSSVRFVKGAYDEPAEVAWKKKRDVDAGYARLIERSLAPDALNSGFYPAFGTHDHRLIAQTMERAEQQGVEKNRFEFQMLLGVRRDWQEKLAREGYGVRIYVPYGTQWFPYFMRRLAERPANVWFMVRALFGR